MDDATTLTFRTSRAKAAPLAMIAPVFLFLFGLPLWAFISSAIDGRDMDYWAVALIAAIFFGLFLFAELRAVRLLLHPDTLALSREGWSMTRFGRASMGRWSDHEGATQYVSSGKTTTRYVRLVPRGGSQPVMIPGERFVQPFGVILDAVQQAQVGRLIDPGPETTPRVYAYGIVPATGLACSLFFGTIVVMAWRIAQRG